MLNIDEMHLLNIYEMTRAVMYVGHAPELSFESIVTPLDDHELS